MDQPRTLTRREALRARRRRPTSITIPERVTPHVRLVFTEMKRQWMTYDEVEEKSGVRRAALKAWRHKNRPGLDSIEAVLGFLGWDFVPVPRERVLDPALVAALAPIAEQFEMTMPATLEVLVALVARIHERAENPRPILDAPSTAPTLSDLSPPPSEAREFRRGREA